MSVESHGDNRRTAETIQRELEFLARRHGHLLALGETSSTKKNTKDRKKILEARHADREFHGNYDMQAGSEDGDDYYLSLFDEFARTVCQTAMIPRKELFECWAMALYVHFHFPPSPEDDEVTENERRTYFKRVADMGCGQGLVSWAILFLDKSRTRTAIGIDKKIPKSTNVIETVMKERHPGVAEFQNTEEEETIEEKEEDRSEPKIQSTWPVKRWHWVEGDICQNVSADSSTLIVGVHCCGTLSDTILDIAISSRSPLALVPCCHTKKSLPKEYQNNPHKIQELLVEDAKKHQKFENDASDVDCQENPPATSLTDYIDRCRIQKLIDAGFDVQEERIPSVITPKNRIIVATPPPPKETITNNDTDTAVDGNNNDIVSKKPSNAPLATNKASDKWVRPKKVFTIPLADTPSARLTVEFQSGRLAADLRQRRPAPNLSLSLYFSDPETTTPEKLNELASAVVLQEHHKHFPDEQGSVIMTHVKLGSKGPFANPDGQLSRSFHICYEVIDPTGRLPQVTKAQAKELHKLVCQRITDNALPGITLRQGLKG